MESVHSSRCVCVGGGGGEWGGWIGGCYQLWVYQYRVVHMCGCIGLRSKSFPPKSHVLTKPEELKCATLSQSGQNKF